jgi:hypothetical protein
VYRENGSENQRAERHCRRFGEGIFRDGRRRVQNRVSGDWNFGQTGTQAPFDIFMTSAKYPMRRKEKFYDSVVRFD